MKIYRLFRYVFVAALLFPVSALGQADLSDPRLEGLDLEYYGPTTNQGASVYLDLTYFRLFASHEKG